MSLNESNKESFQKKDTMRSEKCPLCQSKSQRVFPKYEIWLFDCDVCRHRFAVVEPNLNHVTEIYGDDYFNGGGTGYGDYLQEAELLRAAGVRYGKLVSRYAKPGTMLDIGAAAGFVLQGFQNAGWRGRGIEPNANMARFGREKLNLDIFNGSLENYQSAEQVELVTLIQVIAHFQNPLAALEKVASLTKTGGFLLVETWRRDSLTAKIFGSNWHEYSPPSVLHWFTKEGLQDSVEKLGFKTTAAGKPAKWINAAHAKSLLKHKLEEMPAGRIFAKGLGIIPDRLNLPYPAEDLFWILCQKIK